MSPLYRTIYSVAAGVCKLFYDTRCASYRNAYCWLYVRGDNRHPGWAIAAVMVQPTVSVVCTAPTLDAI